MARKFPPSARVVCVRLATSRDIVADASEAAYGLVPRNGVIVGIDEGCDQMTSVGGGGDAPHTGITSKVVADVGGAAARDLCSAAAVGASSAIVKGGLAATLTTTLADRRVTEGEKLSMNVDITGGTNPIARGLWANVYIAID